MTQRRIFTLALAAAGILSAAEVHAQPPNRLPDLGGQPTPAVMPATGRTPGFLRLDAGSPQANSNQRMAEAIAAHLRDSGQLKRYALDVRFQNGVATLYGRVANDMQRQTALRLARSVGGVEVVRDQLHVEDRTLVPAQAFDPLQLPEVGPIQQPIFNQDEQVAPPTPVPGNTPNASAGAGMEEPEPIFRACQPNGMTQPPLLPPYAWPTYAPYNNYSRVAYPTLYPYEAWPFIGPFYPFPKVPMGWRSVTLSWEDGYWWYGRNATGHDWWRVRYW